MTNTIDQTTTTHSRRSTALYIGLALTVIATIAPLLDIATIDTLTAHVRDAYPDWGSDVVSADRNAIAIWIAVGSGLGIPLWLLTIWAVNAQKRWARVVAVIGFALGLLVALINLSIGGDRYDVVVPYAYGTLTLLPCVAGIAAMVAIWRKRTGPRG